MHKQKKYKQQEFQRSDNCPDSNRLQRDTGDKSKDQHTARGVLGDVRGDALVSWKASTAAGSARLQLEYTLSLQVGVCVVAPEALGVLAHVAALGARLRRRDQPVEQTLVATDGSLR